MARPKKEIDYKIVNSLGKIMCTEEEIANILNISVRTLQRDEEFCRVYKKSLDEGKKSLRRYQFEIAKTNPTMAIWLGKQYLGQRDLQEVKQETTIVDNISPILNMLKEKDE